MGEKVMPCKYLDVTIGGMGLWVHTSLVNECIRKEGEKMTFGCDAETDAGGERKTLDRIEVTGLCACEFQPNIMLACKLRQVRLLRDLARK